MVSAGLGVGPTQKEAAPASFWFGPAEPPPISPEIAGEYGDGYDSRCVGQVSRPATTNGRLGNLAQVARTAAYPRFTLKGMIAEEDWPDDFHPRRQEAARENTITSNPR